MDKYSGAVAGVRAAAGSEPEDAEQVARNTGVEELLTLSDGRVLKAALSAATGAVAWAPLHSAAQLDAELRRVVAQSQMAGMLKDARRNEAYAAAIGAAVQAFAAAAGRAPAVLDVGAGTGLLSMLAAAAGAGRVTAVEQWPVMAAIARDVIAANRAAGALPPACAIDVLARRSFDVAVPADMPSRADLVVSEILDSALLGEGIVESLRHAYAHLVAAAALSGGGGGGGGGAPAGSDARALPPACVPLRATLRAQLVSSALLAAWGDSSRAQLRPGLPLRAQRPGAAPCRASPVAVPVHAARLRPAPVPLSAPFVVCELDFSPNGLAPDHPVWSTPHVVAVPALAAGATPADALLFWWDCVLWEGVEYGTAPAALAAAWQDHWVQCAVALPQPVLPSIDARTGCASWTVVASVSSLRVDFVVGGGGAAVWPSKRAFSMAVKAGLAATPPPEQPVLFTEPELCTCGLHRACTHERRWALADPAWTAAISAAVDDRLRGLPPGAPARALSLGEGSLCALAAASSPPTAAGGGSGPLAIVAVESSRVAQHHADTLLRAALAARDAATEEAALLVVAVVAPVDDLLEGLLAAITDDHGDGEDDNDGDEGGGGAGGDDVGASAGDGAVHAAPASAPSLPVFDVVLAEPYFVTLANAPLWTAAHLWRRFAALAAQPSFAAAFAQRRVMPLRAALRCQALAFAQLAATHGAVGAVRGFDHAPFDAAARGFAEHTFAYPLWQYEFARASEPATLLELDFAAPAAAAAPAGAAVLTAARAANAVAFWMDYELAPGIWVSTGPAQDGAPTPWRQAVRFLPPACDSAASAAEEARAVAVTAVLGGGGGLEVTAALVAASV